MTDILVGLLLALAIGATWLAVAGFARLTSALDRLHCVAFVNIAAGVPIVAAAFIADGLSTRAFKMVAMLVVTLVAGAAVNQAVARAIVTRAQSEENA